MKQVMTDDTNRKVEGLYRDYLNPNYKYTNKDLDKHLEDDIECYTIREWIEYGIEQGFVEDLNIDGLSDDEINEIISWIDYLESK